MIAPLLALMMLMQALPALQEGGKVTGVLRTPAGMPAAGVRVAATLSPVARPDIVAGTLISLDETDQGGRFVLENIPPGTYYIVAGRVDIPTYYPGTLEMTGGTIVAIGPGDTISGIDFAVMDSSTRPSTPAPSVPRTTQVTIPIAVTVEGGGPLPVSAGGQLTTIQFDHSSGRTGPLAPIGSPSITVPVTAGVSDDYRIRVDNLPVGYVVKSMTFNSNDLTTNPLRVSADMAVPRPLLRIVTFTGQGELQAAVDRVTQRMANTSNVLQITLSAAGPSQPKAGALVTGRIKGVVLRAIYLSGMPGTLYSDGTFEFHDVPPGRHIIATLNNPQSSRPLGVSVVVGDRDVSGVELDETPLLPADLHQLNVPEPRGEHAPGAVLRLAAVRGRVLDQSRIGGTQGTVFIVGDSRVAFPIDADGRFEIPRLFPGTYELEFQVEGHERIKRTLALANEDLDLNVALR